MEGYDWIVQWSMFHFSIPFALDIQRGRLCFVVLSETVLGYPLSYTPKMTQEYVDVAISEMPDMGECWGGHGQHNIITFFSGGCMGVYYHPQRPCSRELSPQLRLIGQITPRYGSSKKI